MHICICIYVYMYMHVYIYVYVVLKADDLEAMIAEIGPGHPGSNESQIPEAPWTPLRVCLCS